MHGQAGHQGPHPAARRRGQRVEARDVAQAQLQQDPALQKLERAVDAGRPARGDQGGRRAPDRPRHDRERAGVALRQRQAARELPLPQLDGPGPFRDPVAQRRPGRGHGRAEQAQRREHVEALGPLQAQRRPQRGIRIVRRRPAQPRHHGTPGQHPQLVSRGFVRVDLAGAVGPGEDDPGHAVHLAHPARDDVADRPRDIARRGAGRQSRQQMQFRRHHEGAEQRATRQPVRSEDANPDPLGQRRIGQQVAALHRLPDDVPGRRGRRSRVGAPHDSMTIQREKTST